MPLQVQFTGTATDPEGGALTYEWDFGDGTPHATTKNAAHTYTQPGTYTARFTVRDAGGLRPIRHRRRSRPPTARPRRRARTTSSTAAS